MLALDLSLLGCDAASFGRVVFDILKDSSAPVIRGQAVQGELFRISCATHPFTQHCITGDLYAHQHCL